MREKNERRMKKVDRKIKKKTWDEKESWRSERT